MKQIKYLFLLLLLLLLAVVGCAPGASQSTSGTDAAEGEDVITYPVEDSPGDPESLARLPAFWSGNSNGIGEPITGGANDPFATAVFTLNTDLPDSPETAVVEQHSFGQMDEANARTLANQLGFTGPLYVQQIAPEFAPTEGTESMVVYTAFDGSRILNISDTGLTIEDRSVVVDYSQPLSFDEKAPFVKANLEAWGLLNFPYEMRELPTGDLVIYRLIDGVVVEQNELNIMMNKEGEISYFDYHPLRLTDSLGNYPLQTAVAAWQQLQTPEGRTTIRYQLLQLPTQDEPSANPINPRSWGYNTETAEEIHLYITPAVYEATDGSGLRLVFGDLTLAGDSDDLAQMAAHLADVLHVWGTISEANGSKMLNVAGWEKIDGIQYENYEGSITYADGEALLHTVDSKTYILASAPQDIPDGLEVFVTVVAQRDTGAAYPVLDWLSISENVDWSQFPVEVTEDEAAAITSVVVDSVELVYFTLYQSVDDGTAADVSYLYVPVWKFSGQTDQGQRANFWVTAVEPSYLQAP